jgi:hypothetical protein
MKRHFSVIFCLLFNSFTFSQAGTIKVAKSEKKDTMKVSGGTLALSSHISCNYTLKNNQKIGYEIGVSGGQIFNQKKYSYLIGLNFCTEEQYYTLSAFNPKEQKTEIAYANSQNHSTYLKLPVEIGATIRFSKKNAQYFGLGLSPEYLLKTKNEYHRLMYSDFYQFNLSGFFTLGIRILHQHARISLTYSKDFFENLKDRNIYDSDGKITGKQKSKTDLVSFSISYGL